MAFIFERTGVQGVVLIKPDVYKDHRGLFLEAFKASEFKQAGIPDTFVQDNISFSKRYVLRGLHFQKHPHAQGKLVFVAKGRIWDVAVDLRRDSSTFKRWVAFELGSHNCHMLWIPEGCAHGFLALEEGCVVQYKCTREYNRESECGIRFDDPDLNIDWPHREVILSEKDKNLPFLKDIMEELF